MQARLLAWTTWDTREPRGANGGSSKIRCDTERIEGNAIRDHLFSRSFGFPDISFEFLPIVRTRGAISLDHDFAH